MTMRRLFVPKAALAGDDIVVEGEGHHHVARVLRATRDEVFCLFDGEGGEANARIVEMDRQRTRFVVEARHTRALPRGARLTLCQGLIRPDRMDWVVQKATELGVAHIVPTVCARSQGHARERQERWLRIAQEAARQCWRPDVPSFGEVQPWGDVVSAMSEQHPASQRVVLWEEASGSISLSRALSSDIAEIVLAIGPEGGLERDEVEMARQHGFMVASLGPRILRAETAAVVALTLAQAATGGLG
jgi:16S rRNA (uracil1498-N3)-methyltransferase